jgi:hypothetical protein
LPQDRHGDSGRKLFSEKAVLLYQVKSFDFKM